MELGWVWPAAFLPEAQSSPTGARNGRRLARGVGGMGGDVQQDKVRHAHDIVSASERAHIVYGRAFPFDGGK